MNKNRKFPQSYFSLLFLAATFLIVIWSLSTKLYDPDLWWHLAAGREMIQHKTLLRTEVFSHTLFGQPWINFEWLSQFLLVGVMNCAGITGLFIGKIALSLSVLFLLVFSMYLSGARGPFLLLLSTVGFGVLRPRLQEKPELFTLNLLGLFVVLLLAGLKSKEASEKKWIPWVLGGLMILWVNLHGGFLYGLALVGTMVLGLRFRNGRKEDIVLLDRAFVVCLAATLVNPHGPFIGNVFLEHWFQFGAGTGLLEEWVPPSLLQVPLYWMLFFATGIALVWNLLRKKTQVYFWIPPVVLFLLLSVQFYRSTALLAFVALPYLAASVPIGKPRLYLWFIALLPLFAVRSTLATTWRPGAVYWRRFPVKACEFLQRTNIQGKLYNSYEFGGYIEWKLGPTTKVFSDGRYLFYPLLEQENRLNQTLFSLRSRNEWPSFFDRYGVDVAVVSPPLFEDSPLLSMFPQEKWALVFWDDAAFVYMKRHTSWEPVILSEEYKYVYPGFPGKLVRHLNEHKVTAENVRGELERHNKDMGFSVLAQQLEQLLTEAKR
jgi:hypothetical protein